jgi:hypothetical protein
MGRWRYSLKLAPGRGVISFKTPAPLLPGTMLLVPIEQEAGEAPEPGRMVRRRGKPMPLPGVKF